MVFARKRFGQNFLTDTNLIRRIAAAINLSPTDHVIEIGPGHGALTEHLLPSGAATTLIEIDRDLAAELQDTFPDVNIICDDVLKVDFKDILGSQPQRVVGNLPYNISTPLLFKLLQEGDRIIDMHFMLQLEVVDRLVAEPGTKAYGRLSIMTQVCCTPEKLFEVPPEAFTPRPKVISAIVRLVPVPEEQKEVVDLSVLEALLIQAFSARRKTLRNALKGALSEDELHDLEIDPRLRPENLTVQDYARCARYIKERGA